MTDKDRQEQLIFNGKFKLITVQTEFRMSIWINGFGIADAFTEKEILPVLYSFHLDEFEENGNFLSVKFRIYPDGLKNYETEINPFEQIVMYDHQTYRLADFEKIFDAGR